MNRTLWKRITTTVFVAGALVSGTAACGPDYDRTEFSGVVKDDFTRDSHDAISVVQMQLHEGLVMKSHIVVWDDDNVQMKLHVRAVDPSLIEVAGVITPRDYAFIGRRPGHTQIQFVADDTVVLTIEADVLPQPAPP